MKHISDEQLENDLAVFSSIEAIAAPNFFYTRLNARMKDENISNEVAFSVKPVLVIIALTLFIFINSLLFNGGTSLVTTNSNENIEALAAAYDQTISN